MSLRVVVPNALGNNERAVNILEEAGCEVARLPADAKGAWTPELIDAYARETDAFLGMFNQTPLSREVITAAHKLRVITSPVIGTEHFDVDTATELGIVVAYGATPENILGVAEAAVMLIAALRKQLPQKMDEMRDGRWRVPFAGNMVRGATIGLIGFGKTARGTAQRLANWESTIIAYDPYVTREDAAAYGVQLVDLDTLLRRSDVVSIMVTLTDETRHIVGRSQLATMKRSAYLVNLSRGACVDEPALIEALDKGEIAGAAVDAWEQEPTRPDNPLRTHPKVIPTGHNAAHSEELYAGHPPTAAENTLRALRGEEPIYVRNPEVLPKWRERLARLGVKEGVLA